jgi:flagellar motor switch protein FliN/FliY
MTTPTPNLSPADRAAAGEAYAQALLKGCAAALSTLLNRAVAMNLQLPLLPDGNALVETVPAPWFISQARFTRGLAGAHDFIFPQQDALTLARLVLGEDGMDTTGVTSDHEDALREMVNQMLSSASSSLKQFFSKPVVLAFADLRLVEATDGWTPPNVNIAVAQITVDGVPRARLALTLAPSVEEEAAIILAGPEEQSSPATGQIAGLEIILDISMPVMVELGRTRMLIKDIVALGPGSVIELDKLAGEPVDLLVNDRPIAKGEVVVIDEHFGIRLTQISQATERIQSLR